MRQKRRVHGRMKSGIFRAALVLAGVLPLLPLRSVFAAEEAYPVLYGREPEGEDPVLALTEPAETYVVETGDSLWRIAQSLWGDGERYSELAEANKDVLSDPNLIYPGMRLTLSRTGYIVRSEAKYGGFQTGEYSFDSPCKWTLGMMESGEAGANCLLSGDGGAVACLIQDRLEETAECVADWQQCAEQIAAYAQERYPGQVSELRFERYYMEGQQDASGEVYLYSYIWHVSPKYPSLTCKVCVGLKLTEHMQAEFVGYAMDYDIHGCVRYMTASFEEHFDGKDADGFTANGYNMGIWPEPEWEQNGLYDSFSFIDAYFADFLEELEPEERRSRQTPARRTVERATRPARSRSE